MRPDSVARVTLGPLTETKLLLNAAGGRRRRCVRQQGLVPFSIVIDNFVALLQFRYIAISVRVKI